jgi:hypothetical protein
VALKVIRSGTLKGADDLRRFRQEAEAIAALDHPHVIPINEIGQEDDQPVLAALVMVLNLALLRLIGGGIWFTLRLGKALEKPSASATSEAGWPPKTWSSNARQVAGWNSSSIDRSRLLATWRSCSSSHDRAGGLVGSASCASVSCTSPPPEAAGRASRLSQ